jgi:MAF protein
MNSEPPILILASASPRRQELVPLLGLAWQIQTAIVDETSIDDPDPGANVMQTAELKASAVASTSGDNCVILAADTIVVLDGQMLNKPIDVDDALRMLRGLRGRVHQVYTGIVVHNKMTNRIVMDVAQVDVPMRNYSNSEISYYISTGDPLDKAGAYAVQHPHFQPAPDLAGCFAAVVGLPLCHVSRALMKTGITIPLDVPHGCQVHNKYDCRIFPSILGS